MADLDSHIIQDRTRLNSHELRDIAPADGERVMRDIERRPLYLILENVYDTYNVGGLFRLADALAVQKIYLCGDTSTPPDTKIVKASVGTYKIVPWEYAKTAIEAVAKVRKEYGEDKRVQVVAIEQSESSIPYSQVQFRFPCVLIVGNESYGVTKETLDHCDVVAEIPMWGVNKSLNVIVSAAIVSYSAITTKN